MPPKSSFEPSPARAGKSKRGNRGAAAAAWRQQQIEAEAAVLENSLNRNRRLAQLQEQSSSAGAAPPSSKKRRRSERAEAQRLQAKRDKVMAGKKAKGTSPKAGHPASPSGGSPGGSPHIQIVHFAADCEAVDDDEVRKHLELELESEQTPAKLLAADKAKTIRQLQAAGAIRTAAAIQGQLDEANATPPPSKLKTQNSSASALKGGSKEETKPIAPPPPDDDDDGADDDDDEEEEDDGGDDDDDDGSEDDDDGDDSEESDESSESSVVDVASSSSLSSGPEGETSAAKVRRRRARTHHANGTKKSDYVMELDKLERQKKKRGYRSRSPSSEDQSADASDNGGRASPSQARPDAQEQEEEQGGDDESDSEAESEEAKSDENNDDDDVPAGGMSDGNDSGDWRVGSPPPPSSPSTGLAAAEREAKKKAQRANAAKQDAATAKALAQAEERLPGGILHQTPVPRVRLTDKQYELQAEVAKNHAWHDERVERLTASGFGLRESVSALKLTQEVGLESTDRAAAYLRANSKTPIDQLTKSMGKVQETLRASSAQAKPTSQRPSQTSMTFGPALSDYVSEHPATEHAAMEIMMYHDAQACGHTSSLSTSANTLLRQLKQNQIHHHHPYLSPMCLAVCDDCTKCQANRKRHLDKELQERARLASVETAGKTGARNLPWRPQDSKVDRTLPRKECSECGMGERELVEGESGNDGRYLYFCTGCKNGWHRTCGGEKIVEWVDNDGTSAYLCPRCRTRREMQEASLRGGGGQAARQGPPRVDSRSSATPLHAPYERTPRRSSTQWDVQRPFVQKETPPKKRRQLPKTQTDEVQTPPMPSDSRTGSSIAADTSVRSATLTSNAVSVKILPYVMWDEAGGGTAKGKGNAETGSGPSAWAWFKRVNIPIRDTAKTLGGGLGPLRNAIILNMQVALAGTTVTERDIQDFVKHNMSVGEEKVWVKKFKAFPWFRDLKVESLIKE